LKELPEEVKKSVAAYLGCVAGAVSKEGYLKAIREAGFQETRVLGEETFPVELYANDPTAKEIVKNLNLSQEKAKDLGKSVASLKVSAVKPAASRSVTAFGGGKREQQGERQDGERALRVLGTDRAIHGVPLQEVWRQDR